MRGPHVRFCSSSLTTVAMVGLVPPVLVSRVVTLIKRILHNLVLKAEDRRWASEIGPLSMLGELTARQTSAAYHVGEIYGRFEWN